MKLPSRHGKLGRVLRAMIDSGPMTAGHIRIKAGLPADTAVTARIRELRDSYDCDIPLAYRFRQLDGSTIYLYHLRSVPVWMRAELRKERDRANESREAAA